MDENFREKYTRLMLGNETLDPQVKGMTSETRKTLIPAGDEVEEVLTDTLAAMKRNPTVEVRNFDPEQTRHDIERLRFWEQLATLHVSVGQMIRDQELLLEDKLQRNANQINSELKTYLKDDNNLAAEFEKLLTYMSRSAFTRKRNQRNT